MSQNKKGFYGVIATFLFIMIMLFVVIGITYVASTVKVKKATVNTELGKYTNIIDAKDTLLSKNCYGIVIKEEELEAGKTCVFPEGFIKGYKVEMTSYPECTDNSKEWEFTSEQGEVYPYFVPILSTNGNICPGKLKIIN